MKQFHNCSEMKGAVLVFGGVVFFSESQDVWYIGKLGVKFSQFFIRGSTGESKRHKFTKIIVDLQKFAFSLKSVGSIEGSIKRTTQVFTP